MWQYEVHEVINVSHTYICQIYLFTIVGVVQDLIPPYTPCTSYCHIWGFPKLRGYPQFSSILHHFVKIFHFGIPSGNLTQLLNIPHLVR